jgi:NAD(P)-dependent dehydrogenase (short-subunit alcohol dehydrogenase family)
MTRQMSNVAELMSMSGRVAAITGGAGHLGRAMAHALAEQGCRLLLIDRDAPAVAAAAAEIRSAFGGQVEHAVVDLESEEERIGVQHTVQQHFGRLDVLLNNASFVGDSKLTGWGVPFEEQTVSTWRRALEVNVTAAFHLTQVLAPQLRAHRNGAVVNIASIYGVVGPDLGLYAGTQMGNPAAYAASKGGLVQLTRWLSTVLAPDIRVNCISPGGIARNQPASFVEKYVERTPLRRMGTEEDLKGAAVYLCTDLSRWVTGQNLVVDGGWTAW